MFAEPFFFYIIGQPSSGNDEMIMDAHSGSARFNI